MVKGLEYKVGRVSKGFCSAISIIEIMSGGVNGVPIPKMVSAVRPCSVSDNLRGRVVKCYIIIYCTILNFFNQKATNQRRFFSAIRYR